MLIRYHGHSEFLLESASGFTILTDPYDASVGYPMKEYAADAVTVSHGHGDHSFKEKAKGNIAIVEEAGRFLLSPGITVTAVPGFHDEMQGAKRGSNLLMKIEMDGLTLAHLGDAGTELTKEQMEALGRVDVLMLPVGGFFTIDAEAAYRVVKQVAPRVVIPMHYKTKANAGWPIADETAFLRFMQVENIAPLPLLRVTKGDLSEQPRLALMEIRP